MNLISPNPFQPRREIPVESLAELTESIKAHGLLQPVAVRKVNGRYELITGERRWRACREAGLIEIPVMLRAASDQEMLEFALIENIQREDLSAVDRARAYRRYLQEFILTQEEAAERLGEDRSTIANYVRLLTLPSEVLELLDRQELSMGHARALLGVPVDRARVTMAQRCVAGGWSVRELERVIQKSLAPVVAEPPQSSQKAAHIADLERQIGSALGTKVTIRAGRKRGTGRITIEFYSLDDFDRIQSLLLGGGSLDP